MTTVTTLMTKNWYYITLVNGQFFTTTTALGTGTLTIKVNLASPSFLSPAINSPLSTCSYFIAYSSSKDTNKRVRLKELRFWNRAMSDNDFKVYDTVTLPLRHPDLAAVFKLSSIDFREEIYGVDNYDSNFIDYSLKYDDQMRTNCPTGLRFYNS